LSGPELHEETPMAEATSDADPTDGAEEGSEEAPPPFENRAARRSKGKGTAKPSANTPGRVHGRSGTVQSPRQYGNRRSG
jgi:hypothetical protein